MNVSGLFFLLNKNADLFMAGLMLKIISERTYWEPSERRKTLADANVKQRKRA